MPEDTSDSAEKFVELQPRFETEVLWNSDSPAVVS